VNPESLGQLTRILQLSITPVALISGVGLLLLSMTNRLGRVIDRSRALAAAATGAEGGASAEREEIRILFRRARLLQLAIATIATSIFLAAIMVVALFIMYVVAADLTILILGLFGVCLLCLVASIGFFLGDVFLSIRWLRVSMGRFVS
jgi:hypothetical protein